ncbi:hypothetical protein FVR03_01165 [Pontibacter qinzhouensis]|uniref:Uncharacterized protein n=1 Tax=Pontibacter qinzhouensis TaxID=2603253 RepID=A0A5C8KFM9_9BACT|nr:hypothetical protein [Pontibacter qinzhouensis]TXK52353.1 hypothetical protein FVR03_01165 [Pontibacter qinzhouensis]
MSSEPFYNPFSFLTDQEARILAEEEERTLPVYSDYSQPYQPGKYNSKKRRQYLGGERRMLLGEEQLKRAA